jgi:hypothetical protein
MLLRHARYLVAIADQAIHAWRGVACLAAHAAAADQAARGQAARAAARPLGPSSSRSNLRCLSGPPCCCSARGPPGPPPRERSSRSRSRRTGTRERHGVTGAFALIARPVTPLFLGFRCELAAPLQRDPPARLATNRPHRRCSCRIHRVAGFATSTGSAGHAGATASSRHAATLASSQRPQ